MSLSSKVTKLSNLKKTIAAVEKGLQEEIEAIRVERSKEIQRAQGSFNSALIEETEEIRSNLFEQYNMGLICSKDYFSQLAKTYLDAYNEAYEIQY